MQETTFVQPGALAKPKIIGRAVRLLLGLLCCYGALSYGESPRELVRLDLPPLGILLGPALALWLLPIVVNLGWGVNWKNRPRLVFLLLCATTIAVDFALYGSFWGPPLGVVLYAATVYTLAHLGLSFLLSALLSTPGCEMRAIPNLLGKLMGHARMEHHCPGMLDPIDKWEARRS